MDIHLEDITKAFGTRRVLRGLSLDAGPGEVVAVTGANGSGKSTLLKIVAGLTRPSRGTVRIGGIEDPAERRARVGYAAPDLMLYPELTGRENLAFFATLRGATVDVDDRLADVGLGTRGGDPVGVYSSGMRQRLRLALATLFDAQVLLLDEPGLALDAAGTALVDRLIARHRTRGGVTLLATNDAREAALATRRIAL